MKIFKGIFHFFIKCFRFFEDIVLDFCEYPIMLLVQLPYLDSGNCNRYIDFSVLFGFNCM